MPLTDIAVRNAKPREKQYKLTDGDGMFLLVHTNGGKYWRFKYRYLGQEKMLALGVYPEITLADARERRMAARKALAHGKDPAQLKQDIRRQNMLKNETTFESIAREWYDQNVHTWVSAWMAKAPTMTIFSPSGSGAV